MRTKNRLGGSRCLLFIFVMLVAAIIPSTSVGQTRSAAPLNEALNRILREEVPGDFAVSIQVVDLATGRTLMERNPDLPLIPASTLKAVTSASALSTLKPDFSFLTRVLVDGKRGDRVGNLYLQGQGDPYLVSEQLFALTRQVREEGLREVGGNIVVDDSYFIPGKPMDEHEELGYRSYHAPYGALSLNFNTIRLTVHPGSRAGREARIQIRPVSEYSLLQGSVKTVKGRRRARLTIKTSTRRDGKYIIRVNGTIGVRAPRKSRYVNVAQPGLYTGAVFKEFLLREGIRVSGKVIKGKTPAKAATYTEFKSRPLGVIVYWLNKFSNNFMAEQVSMAMGAKVFGAPGTRKKGISVMRDYLLRSGVKQGSFSLAEASGLSRKNRISSSALVRVLMNAVHDFTYGPEYVASMGVAGVDGTLKEKFTGRKVRRRLRAKTGSLRGVTALAGYGVFPNRRRFVFAVLVNSLSEGKGFIDYAEKIVSRIMKLTVN